MVGWHGGRSQNKLCVVGNDIIHKNDEDHIYDNFNGGVSNCKDEDDCDDDDNEEKMERIMATKRK